MAQTKSATLVEYLTGKTNAISQLSRRYEQLLRSEKYYDCIFHIAGTKVKCHKLILSTASPVFEAMFYGPIREEQLEIEILDFSVDIFKQLIDYIYTGEICFDKLTLEETVELYYGAEKYLLNDLIADCLLAITRKLRFSNILPALELSVCLDLSGLQEVCMTFFTRCCLVDPQYMAYLKLHYLHISKDCLKAIIALNKQLQKQLLWFVYEWCQHECSKLGLQQNDYALIMHDLQLQQCGLEYTDLLHLKPHALQCCAIERSYYKACRPFTIDCDSSAWKFRIKCDRFISLLGIIMHSRLAPKLNALMTGGTTFWPANAHMAHAFNEYNENLSIEITAQRVTSAANDNDDVEDADAPNCDTSVIWRHTINKQLTKYNCDFNIRWDEGVSLSPEFEYEIKLLWQADAYGAEYPCSLQSNVVDGIQFDDIDAHYEGSLIKGLRFINLV